MATKSEKIIYWVATGYMLLLMMMSVVSYHINHDGMAAMFVAFGYFQSTRGSDPRSAPTPILG